MFCKKDCRFKLYVNCTNTKYIDAHNLSYSLCTGEYVVRLDGDDIPDRQMLEKYIEFMDEHHEYDACCSSILPLWSNSLTGMLEKPDESDDVTEEIRTKWFGIFPKDADTDNFNKAPAMTHTFKNSLCWCNQCSCIRREFLLRHKLKFKYCNSGDYLFWVEFFAEGGNAYKLKDVLLKYRIHRGSISRDGQWMKVSNQFQVDFATAKIKIINAAKEPNYEKATRVFENTIKYFNDLIKKEQENQ
jgi:glycosyltransferase involved in cell wall biosynthesis